MEVTVLSNVVQRLESLQEPRATLYGYKSAENSVTVITFLLQVEDQEYENILPGGLDNVGVFGEALDIISTDVMLALIRDEGKLKCYTQEDDQFQETEFNTTDEVKMATLRVRVKIPLQLSSKDEETDILFDKLIDRINSDAAAFLMDRSRIAIICSGFKSLLIGAAQDVSTEELALLIKDEDDDEDQSSRKKKTLDRSVPLDFRLYWSSVADETDGSIPHYAPLIYHQKRVHPMMCFSLSLNTLSLIPWSEPAENIGPILSTSITRQLKLFLEDFKEQLRHVPVEDVEIPQIFHFFPEELSHYVTLVYHPKKTDEDLRNYRKQLHYQLALSERRPYLRRGNRYLFPDDPSTPHQLINTHIGLNLKSSFSGGTVALVQGRYAYHHYMQDNFNDDGWGCAYRSLQTIISWFRLQGYTESPVPTHKEIQQCLVNIGDKPASFAGSRQWIGSMEVSFCLQSLLGIESTIINVSSGAEMPYKAKQIADHFQNYGTPIMIGGGVLAHTIIGIDYSDDSNEARFLILDPHYTGSEDLKTIQSKGWCNWKPSTFWKANSFYNMCLPLRPVTY